MTTGVTSRQCCLTQERVLQELIGGLYPHDLDPNTYGFSGMLDFIEGRSGVARIDIAGDQPGKEKPTNSSNTRWEIKYKTKRCAAPKEGADCSDPCGSVAADLNAWKYAHPTISTPIYEEFTIDLADYQNLCDGSRDFFVDHLREVYESMKEQANDRYITQFQANLGNYFSTDPDCVDARNSATDPVTLNLLDAEGKPQPRGLYQVPAQYRRMGLRGVSPVLVGGNLLDAMQWSLPFFTGANDVNIDRNASRTPGGMPEVFVDYAVDQIFADGLEHVLSVVPGAVHRMYWHKFTGENAYSSPTLTKRTFDLGAAFNDPNFTVDQSIFIDECGDCDVRIIYKFWLYTDLFTIPSDAFNTTTCGQCSNYLLGWLADCGAIDCTTFETPIAAPGV